jgi:predicted hydrocarbon binding protein
VAVHVKGVVLKSRIPYVEKFHGKDAVGRVLEALSPEARAMVGGEILVSSWYPLQATIETLVTIDRLFGKGDLELCREMGRYTARVALEGGVQQSFVREHDPAFVIKMAPVIWQQYYDSGEIKVEQTGEESAISRLMGFEEPHRALCLSVLGWMEEAIEIWGGTEIHVVETKCQTRGDSCCEFVASWVTPPEPPAE